MKNIFNITFILLAFAFSACAPSEVDDLFDESAAVRLNNAIENYTEYFKKDGGMWQMQYFANEYDPGFVYIVTFNNDGSVKMTGKNDYIEQVTGKKMDSDISLWEVIADNGPVLSFNSYNEVFHFFCSPLDDGEGLMGDFEFMIMKAEEDYAVLKGKKWGHTIIMNRLDRNTDEEAYFNSIDKAKKAFTNSIPKIIMTTGSGFKYICSGQQKMFWAFYPETGNALDNTDYMNAIITPTTIRFMDPLDFMTDYEPDQVPAQNFVLQDDGSYLCVEDGVTRITAPPLAYVLMQFNTTRDMPRDDMTGDFAVIYDNMKEKTAANKNIRELQYLQINYYTTIIDGDKNRYIYNLYFKTNRREGNLRMEITKVNDNTVKFSFDKNASSYEAFDTNNAKSFYDIEEVQDFIDLLCQGEYTIESSSVLNPNPMVIKSSTNANNSFNIKF